MLRRVEAERDRRILRQRGKSAQLAITDDLIAHKDVLHAAAYQGLCLADLLYALTCSALRDLLQRDGNRFVGLGMRTHANPCRARKLGHSRNVTIERVEVDDERRGVDVIDGSTDLGGRRIHRSHPNIRGAHMTTSGQMQMIAIMISSAITNGAEPSSTSDSLPRPRMP